MSYRNYAWTQAGGPIVPEKPLPASPAPVEGGAETRLRARIHNLVDRGRLICPQWVDPDIQSAATQSCGQCGYTADVHLLRDALDLVSSLSQQLAWANARNIEVSKKADELEQQLAEARKENKQLRDRVLELKGVEARVIREYYAMQQRAEQAEAKYAEAEKVTVRQLDSLRAELASAEADRDRYKKALSDHLCPSDMADWLACNGDHPSELCDICAEGDKGQHRHALLVRAEKAETERDAMRVQLLGTHETRPVLPPSGADSGRRTEQAQGAGMG